LDLSNWGSHQNQNFVKNSNLLKSCPKVVKFELKDEIIKKNLSSQKAVDFDGFFQLFVMN